MYSCELPDTVGAVLWFMITTFTSNKPYKNMSVVNDGDFIEAINKLKK